MTYSIMKCRVLLYVLYHLCIAIAIVNKQFTSVECWASSGKGRAKILHFKHKGMDNLLHQECLHVNGNGQKGYPIKHLMLVCPDSLYLANRVHYRR